MSCGNPNCTCGSSCSCGSDCGCGKYSDFSGEGNFTSESMIMGVAPQKGYFAEGSEMGFASENDCKCGANCTCDPCKCGK